MSERPQHPSVPKSPEASSAPMPLDEADFVIRALRRVREHLDQDVAKRDAKRPSITDSKEQLSKALVEAGELAGRRKMFDELLTVLNLTEVFKDDNKPDITQKLI